MNRSKKHLTWGMILSVIGLAGILYNFIFEIEFASRVVNFLVGFVFGISLGMGTVFLLNSLRKSAS